MPFTAPSWVPPLPPIPDSISLDRFMLDERYGRAPVAASRPPFTCALSGKSYSVSEVRSRVDHLARALGQQLGWRSDDGSSEWDKVVAVFSLNTIDYLTLAWAVHRLGGLLTCVNAAYNARELEFQLKDSGAKAIFTCAPLLATCRDATQHAGIADDRVFLMPLPEPLASAAGAPPSQHHQTIDDLIAAGAQLPSIRPADEAWGAGDGARRIAFLCYSSGTSGLPKGVKITHVNCIANILQNVTFESLDRAEQVKKSGNANFTEMSLGLLPFSHIYGLIVLIHVGPYRGDGVVVMPRYDFAGMLQSIQRYKINILYLVPPMIIHMINQREACKKYDLSSVRAAFSGAAPLGKSTIAELNALFPEWAVRQGYGSTESCTVVTSTPTADLFPGSAGSILPGMTVRLVSPVDGSEILARDTPGELWVESPSVVPGYLNRAEANAETFVERFGGRYLRTGDEAIVTLSPRGHEHVVITDRIKELIKVKGFQVAPAELEAHLLAHPAVSDCVVIGVESAREGEVPKAFVVKAHGSIEESDALLKRSIKRHVEQHLSRHKWLAGGVEFIDVVPKSPSGKILRRLVRDQEREKRKKAGAKL